MSKLLTAKQLTKIRHHVGAEELHELLDDAEDLLDHIDALQGRIDKVMSLTCFDVHLAPNGEKGVWLSDVKAILEEQS